MKVIRNIFRSAVRLTPIVLLLLLAFVWVRSRYWFDRNTIFLHRETGAGAYVFYSNLYTSRGYVEFSWSYGRTAASVEGDVARNRYFSYSGYPGGSLKINEFRYASQRDNFLAGYWASSAMWRVVNFPMWALLPLPIGLMVLQALLWLRRKRRAAAMSPSFPVLPAKPENTQREKFLAKLRRWISRPGFQLQT